MIDKQSRSNTDSSNASHSTPMEIGDIQIVMQHELTQKLHQQKLHPERRDSNGRVLLRDKQGSDENHEIRSQDNRQKHRARGRRTQVITQIRDMGDLSENDTAEKVSDIDEKVVYSSEDYEAISAPVKRANNKNRNKPSSAYKLSSQTGKISIDSLTELSSPCDDGSSS